MKILKTADDWWVGKDIRCDCGTHFELESGDPVKVEKNEDPRGGIFFQASFKCPTCFKEYGVCSNYND